MLQTAMFRTATLRAAPKRGADKRTKAVYGAKIIQLGEVNDSRPFEVDNVTLQQVADAINGPNKGLKARWTHPHLCEDGMGKHLGYWTNARIDGDAVVADLHLSETAFKSPAGDLGNYVLELAEEDPDAFGVSVAGRFTTEMEQELEASEPGTIVPIRFERLRAADVVADPAATRGGMFSVDDFGLAGYGEQFIRLAFGDADGQEVFERVTAFLESFYGRTFMSQTETPAVADTVETTPQHEPINFREDAKPFIDAFGDQGARFFLEGRELIDCFRQQYALKCEQLEEANETIRHLNTQLEEIAASDGESDPLSSEPKVELSARDQAIAQRVEQLKRQGVPENQARAAASVFGRN